MVSADDQDTVTGARGMEVTMDEKLSEIDDQCDLVVLPGGIPGFKPQDKFKGSGHGQGTE
ncbi:MAG: DJ-1/PfpI family protein [Coprococcus sp.]